MQFLPSAAPADVGLCPLRAQRLLAEAQAGQDGGRQHRSEAKTTAHGNSTKSSLP